MKYSILIALICLAVFVLFYVVLDPDIDSSFVLGALGGIGLGFIVGSILGYSTKKTKVITKEVKDITRDTEINA